jgi:hypothetical protein
MELQSGKIEQAVSAGSMARACGSSLEPERLRLYHAPPWRAACGGQERGGGGRLREKQKRGILLKPEKVEDMHRALVSPSGVGYSRKAQISGSLLCREGYDPFISQVNGRSLRTSRTC